MILDHAIQVDAEAIREIDFDLFLASSGFEKRAPYFFVTNPLKNKANRKFVLSYSDRDILKNGYNLEIFKGLGFEVIESYEHSHSEAFNIINKIFSDDSNQKPEFNILIDYSCMTKVWYASVLNAIRKIDHPWLTRLNLFFAYTEAIFENPFGTNPNYSASFVSGYNNMDTPHKKVALIIGLGYEENRALGMIEYLHLDYENCYVFKTDKISNPEFYDVVLNSNKELLELVPADHIYDYPLNDLRYTDALLSTLTNHLARDKRVIIAPIGPKPFSLLSFLIATKHRGISVFRITQTANDLPADRHPALEKKAIICMAVFRSENSDDVA